MGGRERGERGGLGQLEEAAAAAVTDFNIPTSFLSLSLSHLCGGGGCCSPGEINRKSTGDYFIRKAYCAWKREAAYVVCVSDIDISNAECSASTVASPFQKL